MPTASKTSRSTSRATKDRNDPSKAEHLWVYCAVRGTPGARALAKLPPLPGGGPPRSVPLTDTIALVVATVPASVYSGPGIESHLSDLNWVARAGTAHHAVADEVARKHTVVPFRLFTLFSSEARARATLGRRAARINEALDRVSGKAEWVLRIGKPIEGAEGARTSDTSGTSGTLFLARKAAARQAAVEKAQRVREDAARTFDTLADIAAEATYHAVDPAAGLLLDAAFLVPARQLPAFKRALSKTAEGLLERGCRVSLTGPWPPYSFVSLEPPLVTRRRSRKSARHA